jgi:predicted exporter
MPSSAPKLDETATPTRAQRFGVLAIWLVVLALAGMWSASTLRVSGDLRLFMPAPRTADQTLMMQLLGEGPGSRLLLVALSGGEPEALAERSRALRESLVEAPEFAWIGNGEESIDSLPEVLQDARYLVSPGPSQGSLEADALKLALRDRLRDLASPAAAMIAPLLARDPTLETLRVLQAWTPATEPERFDGVWMSRDLQQALLLVETRAPGFDPVGQQAALQRLRDAHAAFDDGGVLEISGPGAFAERMSRQTSSEASALGTAATIILILLLAVAYRSITLPFYGALPLATGAIAGLVATTLFFGDVHGITLAFGFTLLGVAQDYPVHLFSHGKPGVGNLATVRHIWPTMAAGTGSSCLAYLIFVFAGVDGLRQLAAFTITGLAIAALTTRYVLPQVLPAVQRDVADAALPHWLQRRLLSRRLPRWPAVVVAILCIASIAFAPAPWWQDDLAALTPVPKPLLQRDRELRAELGAPDVRWLLVVRGDDAEQVLQRSESLQADLDRLVGEGVLASYDFAARYLPSQKVQRERQAALPAPAELRDDLLAAQAGTQFAANAFAPFLDAVERARTRAPLTPDDLAGTPLQMRIDALLRPSDDAVLGLISLSGLQKAEVLAAWAEAQPGVHLLDLKATAQSLASAWRARLLWAMSAAWILLCIGITWSVGDWRRAVRVLLPVALGTAAVLALFHALAIELTLFHLVSLVLAACLGVDYALFLERAGTNAQDQRRTLHALVVCSLSTLLVFALLALSQMPVLRAIGLTVGLGVLAQTLLAWLLTSRPTAPEAPA